MAYNEQFIAFGTRSALEADLANGNVKPTSLAFVEEKGEEALHTQDKTYHFVPGGGHERQILAWDEDGKAKWDDLANMFTGLEELLAYGVEWKDNVADPHLTRIGNMSLHKTLPIQSQLKGCIAQGDKIMYWLDENDWRFKKDSVITSVTCMRISPDEGTEVPSDLHSWGDMIGLNVGQYFRYEGILFQLKESSGAKYIAIIEGEPEETPLFEHMQAYDVEPGSNLSGYDGTVRVYCPNFYIKSQIIGNTRRVWLSTVKIDNTWTYQHEILIDAYRSTVLNTVPENMGYLSTLPVNSAISVVNTATYCRGGGNRANFDQYLNGVEASEGVEAVAKDIFRTDLGKPRTYISRAVMRTDSRNADSEMLSYDQYKNIFYWLYVVEYANFNCQEAYNAELTDEGYHQGGMGPSITNVDSTKWSEYNGYYPITPCGYGNDLGNGTGLKTIVLPATANRAESTHYMARWRGFDNPFGDIWTNLDGVIIDADANNHPNNMNYVYTCQDPTKYADNLNGDGYEKVGEEIHQDGYTKLFDLGDAAHIIPNVMGGNTTQYKCDYHWTGDKNATLRTLLVGSCANAGSNAGLGAFHSLHGLSTSWAVVGFRSVSSFMSFQTVEQE